MANFPERVNLLIISLTLNLLSHPSGVIFTNPPGRSLDWPDCTRKHSTKGQRSDIYMEYALEDGDNCEENLHELKRAFKEQNTNKIVGEPLPGFK